MTASTQIVRFSAKNPRNNLPVEVRNKRSELLFQNSFLRKYLNTIDGRGVAGSQFELQGCGIADFIWVGVDGNIDAFEFKMKDWKKGATQASRYRAYASRTILVMPADAVAPALKFLDCFRSIDLGLWSFDSKTGTIVSHHTPAVRQPLDLTLSQKASTVLLGKRHFRKLRESV